MGYLKICDPRYAATHCSVMLIHRFPSSLSIAIFCSCSMFMFISNSQLAPLELLPMLFLGHDMSLLCPLVLSLSHSMLLCPKLLLYLCPLALLTGEAVIVVDYGIFFRHGVIS